MSITNHLLGKRAFARGAALFLAFAANAFAHDPGLSSADLTIGGSDVQATLTFSETDVAAITYAGNLQEVAERAALLDSVDGARMPTRATVRREANNVAFDLTFPSPAGERPVTFRSALLFELPFGHRQEFVVHDTRGSEVMRRLLSQRDDSVVISIAAAPAAAGSSARFFDFLLLGIRHILTGYDHLLFLFGLLIVTRAPRPALLLITCFTIAHSVTLALATFGIVELPSRFVEATIAASIVYVGIENLTRSDTVLRWRWMLTLAFGLIHGLGFATALREMGIAKTGTAAVVPLVAFNTGVELGQIAVAAVVLPVIWKLRDRAAFIRIGIPACSCVVAAAGAFWFIQRTLFS
jgi:hydrogenase/urease accessory protein HupE